MATISTEPKEIKILVHGSPRNLAWSYRNNLHSYFNTHKNSEQSFYWEILIGSIRYGLAQYCQLATNTEVKEQAEQLTDKLSSLSHPAEAEAVATTLQQIVQMWETDEFQRDFNATWNPETLHTKYWLKTFVPLAHELLNSKRDITNEDLVESNIGITGILEDQHSYGNSRVTTTLIGGRRAERRKWLHAFDNVSALLLCISAEAFLIEESTGYVEDRQSIMNMIRETSGSRFMTNAPLFLFISRINLLEDMIKGGGDVKKYLPNDYNGEINARAIVLHFVDKFCELRSKDKPMFVICGDLVDRQAMKMIIPFVFQTLILSDSSTKQLSNVTVDPERNLVVYYPTNARSTFADEVLRAAASAEPCTLASLLKNSDNVYETCKSLLNNELHADLKLKVGETTLVAHSLVLRARIPELLTLWTDNGTSSDIVITDMDSQATQQFLEYIYTDAIKSIEDVELIAGHQVIQLLFFADKYALNSFMLYLCKVVADKMNYSKQSNTKPKIDVQLVQELLHFGEAAGSDYLKLKCTECLLFLEEDNTPAKITPEKKPKKRAGCTIC